MGESSEISIYRTPDQQVPLAQPLIFNALFKRGAETGLDRRSHAAPAPYGGRPNGGPAEPCPLPGTAGRAGIESRSEC